MREIKFRVWCHDKQDWEDDEVLLTLNGLFREFKMNGKWRDVTKTHTVEFYTGLKDEEGIEIYENDIVNVDGTIGVVSFTGGRWGVVEKHGIDSLFRYRKQDIKVIGNIHNEST